MGKIDPSSLFSEYLLFPPRCSTASRANSPYSLSFFSPLSLLVDEGTFFSSPERLIYSLFFSRMIDPFAAFSEIPRLPPIRGLENAPFPSNDEFPSARVTHHMLSSQVILLLLFPPPFFRNSMVARAYFANLNVQSFLPLLSGRRSPPLFSRWGGFFTGGVIVDFRRVPFLEPKLCLASSPGKREPLRKGVYSVPFFLF